MDNNYNNYNRNSYGQVPQQGGYNQYGQVPQQGGYNRLSDIFRLLKFVGE